MSKPNFTGTKRRHLLTQLSRNVPRWAILHVEDYGESIFSSGLNV